MRLSRGAASHPLRTHRRVHGKGERVLRRDPADALDNAAVVIKTHGNVHAVADTTIVALVIIVVVCGMADFAHFFVSR